MSLNLERLDKRAKEFNTKYRTNFSYSGFMGKARTLEKLKSKDTANVVYKGTLAGVLKDAMVNACSLERTANDGAVHAVDLQSVAEEFEYYLMQPFVMECKSAGEALYPQPYGGMSEEQRIELAEHVLSASPKNDAELTEKAYLKGEISIDDMRAVTNEIDFTNSVSEADLKRVGSFMLALANANKSRSFVWKVFHPIKNYIEKRDAKEMRTRLSALGDNAVSLAESLARSEYSTITFTKESLQNAKADLARRRSNEEKLSSKQKSVENGADSLENSNVRDSLKIDLGGADKSDVAPKVSDLKKKEPVKNKNV